MTRRVAVLACALLLACGASRPPIREEAPQTSLDAGTSLEGSDLDGDAIVYENDVCPCEAEDVDGFEDGDGCPDPDNDHDQIVDACDLCPNDPETYNGHCDADGCPDHGFVCIEPSRIQITQSIYFARGSSTLLATSAPVLDAIAAALNGNPQLTLVAFIGEAELRERHRDALALARATAVLEAMVERGVARERLVAEADPTPVHDPSEAAELWRRVRFVIRTIDQEAYDESAPTGGRCGGHEDPSSCQVPVCDPPAIVHAC